MDEMVVRIVELPAMRVMRFNGYGEGPEALSFEKLAAWAKKHDMRGRVFGFNEPNPQPEKREYGYSTWMVVDPGVQAEGDGSIIDFRGGLYAVALCDVQNPAGDIPAAWERLAHWVQGSEYELAQHQWLEEALDWTYDGATDSFRLDLYCPIRRR